MEKMMEAKELANRKVVERLAACINARQIEVTRLNPMNVRRLA